MQSLNISNDMPHSSVNTNANICLVQRQKVSLINVERVKNIYINFIYFYTSLVVIQKIFTSYSDVAQ